MIRAQLGTSAGTGSGRNVCIIPTPLYTLQGLITVLSSINDNKARFIKWGNIQYLPTGAPKGVYSLDGPATLYLIQACMTAVYASN